MFGDQQRLVCVVLFLLQSVVPAVPGILLPNVVVKSEAQVGASATSPVRHRIGLPLLADTLYEVRVLHTAALPAVFDVWLEVADEAHSSVPSATPVSRRLFNVEKIMFRTDSAGLVQGSAAVHVSVSAQAVAAAVRTPTVVPFQITLEAVLFGSLPVGAWRLLVVGGAALMVTAALVKLLRPKFINFLTY
eukprot:gnl/Spiro4/26207_TR13062_c0_g1_i1.p2 gnl/Spiro4/26207_TR13062_c0_g1~~gnl/Spiro4/26207_TR13062_c0_g1_i1.p2  ORF type:complete len:190 (-),score=34.49 gnl/Spiro4/26207_TR13062_c0_g1_i1:47-616(-)